MNREEKIHNSITMRHIIIILTLALSGCIDILMFDPALEPIPIDSIDTTIIPIDTVVLPIDTVPLPLALDTCFELADIDTPAFTILSTMYSNGSPLISEWGFVGISETFFDVGSLLEFLYPQYDYTVYEGNDAIVVIVDGVTNNSLFQGKIFTFDAIGQKQLLTAFGRSLYFWGALTFDEALAEASKRPSLTSFHYTNTSWSVPQNNEYARKVLHADLCKEGEYRADFRAGLGVEQTVVDSFNLFEWEVVLQLNDQLIRA